MPSLPNTNIKKVLITGCLVISLLVFSIYLLRAGTSTFPGSGTSSASTSAKSTETPTSTGTPMRRSPTSVPTVATPTAALHYTTIKTFSGDGDLNTPPFDVKGDWEIVWSCTGSEGGAISIVLNYIYNGFAVPLNAVDFSCYNGFNVPNEDSSKIYKGGRYSLQISDNGSDWNVDIDEVSLK